MGKKSRDVPVHSDPLSPRYFRWQVSEHGYSVTRASVDTLWSAGMPPRTEEAVLVPNNLRMTVTIPLVDPELFRAFGNTPITAEGVLAFASRYGFLGLAGRIVYLTENGPVRSEWIGELVADWEREIRAIRTATLLWDAIEEHDLPELRRYVRRLGTLDSQRFPGGVWIEYGEPETWVLLQRDDGGEICSRRGLGTIDPSRQATFDDWEAARQLLIQEINAQIRKHCQPFLTSSADPKDPLRLRVGPSNLLGAMWWQLCRLVTGQVRYQRCRQCRQLIVVANRGVGSREDREFCSNACKMKDHRLKAKAKRLKAQGQTERQIASKLKTTTEIVNRWITNKKST